MAEPVQPETTPSDPMNRVWVVGGLLGLFVYFNVRNPPDAFKPSKRRGKALEGTSAHHETEAHRYAARGTSRACSTQGLKALLAAQTAYVHAKESGNASLTSRLERQRDAILERSNACCYGGGR